MKISPVAGTPTIPQPGNTGLAPEKLARIKGIASGNPVVVPPAIEDDKAKLLEATQKIAMQTNKTPQAIDPLLDAENAVSDTDVQATQGSEATRPISPQLAALARQKRALQVKEREIDGKLEAAKTAALAEYKAKLKSNALSVLQEEGVSYDQLTQEILGQTNGYNPEIDKLKAEIAALKGDVDTKFSQADEAQNVSAINYVADKLDALIAGSPADFELLTSAEEEEEVIRRVYDHWKKTGKELNVATVAKEYQEELLTEAVRFANLGLVQKKLTPTVPAQVTSQPSQSGIRTLTNKDSARPAMGRRERAILAMQGQLKR